VVYVLMGRPRGLVSSFLAVVPPTAISLKVAYDADWLAARGATDSHAVAQGHHVAVVVAICAVGAAVLRAALAPSLDERLKQVALPVRVRRRATWVGWVSALGAVVIVVATFHGAIAREYHRFLTPAGPGNRGDLRARLTDPANNGRLEEWKVAWHQFQRAPVLGHGAGTFQDTWARYRPDTLFVRDAHSLYLETLDELGVVGLALLLVAILSVLARAASRVRGPGRPLYAAVFAVLLGWALHAGLDWDWEMPVVTVIFFSLGGFVLSRPARPSQPAEQNPSALPAGVPIRAAAGLAFALLAVLPAFTWVSQVKLDDAAYAFSRGDCRTAQHSALSSISTLGIRAEPYEFVAYCDMRLGMPRLALAAIDHAVRLDPGNWNYRYDVGLMRAAAGVDPRSAARLALAMDPREPLVRREWNALRTGNPTKWKAEAHAIADAFTTL
jgi:hypothetical protein